MPIEPKSYAQLDSQLNQLKESMAQKPGQISLSELADKKLISEAKRARTRAETGAQKVGELLNRVKDFKTIENAEAFKEAVRIKKRLDKEEQEKNEKIDRQLTILKELVVIWRDNIFAFVDYMWHLKPQAPLPEFEVAVKILVDQQDWQNIKAEWFEPYKPGVHMTWQQYVILEMMQAAITGKARKRISIASGHGIGKSCAMSWILLWHLVTHKDSQIACTAPTSKQMFDVLWKEVSLWISRMPSGFHSWFDRQSTYIRMTSSPDTWFASAKTAKAGSTEALAGVHGPHVMILADEASGVDHETFDTMEGSLTESDYYVVLFSNPTRLEGYFYDTHHKMKHKWQVARFSNNDCPRRRPDYAQDIIDMHGMNSSEYRIRVLGEFPEEGLADDKGYTPIISKEKLVEIERPQALRFVGKRIMGIDPAGEGRDETVWVVRDAFMAAEIAREKTSTPFSVAARTRTLATLYEVSPEDIYIDSFGVGAAVVAECAKTWFKINAVNVGDACPKESDRGLYQNLKAKLYMELAKVLTNGLQLVRNKQWAEQAVKVKFRRNERNRIQIMSKKEYKKLYGTSPDLMEALMLTFCGKIESMGAGKTMVRAERPTVGKTVKTSSLGNRNSVI